MERPSKLRAAWRGIVGLAATELWPENTQEEAASGAASQRRAEAAGRDPMPLLKLA